MQQPINFVSDFFKRDRYLQSYSQPLEAIKGDEFWEFQTTDPLLPPDIPKKLRGRPKKLRRREEWEGGNRIRASQPIHQGSDILRYTTTRVMHCSVCGATGHRKNKCPTPQEEFSKGKEKSKETTTTQTTTETDKPKRKYKPKRKACIPWRTKNTASQAFELKRAPSQRKKLEIRRKPALSIREEDEEYLDQDF
ncbi:hypothetical protein POM88_000319 [Heracleum sosnowskyi]|uniref:CCHC-type domain-containing protein n=1 Tax=Heracleum sosnowskyi TaxID=360622 RepID=A0AAD8N8K9_9APIA|nr:hypothetical protein POM88_000319 [Heracleum sosnowskyi]